MGRHLRQVKIVALCASLLAVLASALVGCGRAVCTIAWAAPPHVVLSVENGVVYGLGDKLFAMRASDGKVLWQNGDNPYFGQTTGVFDMGAPVAPAVDGQTVIETMGIGLIVALRATDGKMLWHSRPLTGLARSVEGTLAHPPVTVDGVIYAAVGYGSIAAWDERDGHTLWVSHFAPNVEATSPNMSTFRAGLPLPVVAGSAVYASTGRSVYALRVSDGAVLWHLPDAPVDITYSALVVATNAVYVADSDGTVIALDPKTGAIRWRSPGRSGVVVAGTRPSIAMQGQTVYVASQGSLARGVNAATGAQRWGYTTHTGDTLIAGQLAPLVAEGGRVYLFSLPLGGLYVLDGATGRELWRASLDNSIFGSSGSLPDLSLLAVDQGMVALVAAKGVEAWRVSDGQELWVAQISDEKDSALVESAAVVAGTVYLAQRGTSGWCGGYGTLPRVLALRETDRTQAWHVSI